jgi:Myristoyl-CoA:protein N-myristoyltransferase, C-terminal domain
VIGNKRYSTLNAAYSYYNVATKTPLVALMKDILIMAKKVGSGLRVLWMYTLGLCMWIPSLSQGLGLLIRAFTSSSPLLRATCSSPASCTAVQRDFDVFNALNVMDNDEFLEPLRFGVGDGHLQFYLYNWKCAPTTPPNVGLVLL